MTRNLIIRNVTLIIVFCAVAIVLFSENIRTVQILGLFACGAVAGASLTKIITALKVKKKDE
jgi:predicted metal-binding protein